MSETPQVTDLVGLLTLREQGLDDRGQDIYEGDSDYQPHGRVFGGQVLAQTLMAAGDTVDADRHVHSMHGYFLRPGDLTVPITFAVERLRDGKSFSARRVHAIQHGKPILSMIASFQDEDEGVDHGTPMPDAPDPDSLPDTKDLLGGIPHPVAKYMAFARPMDIRHCEETLYFDPVKPPTDRQMMWLRTREPLPADDTGLHRAVLAYGSDYAMLESVLRRHGMAWTTLGLKAASLDHAMWWHRPFRADEWILCVQDSPSASGARGLARATFYTQDGRHVATAAQELMVRAGA